MKQSLFSEIKVHSMTGALVSNQFDFYLYCKNGKLYPSFNKPKKSEQINLTIKEGKLV